MEDNKMVLYYIAFRFIGFFGIEDSDYKKGL
jgi:hypothetical protein